MAAHLAPPSLGFSWQEHWSGLPFPSPMRENEVAQSCPTLRNPMDCSPPGSPVHGIFHARVLEWCAIAFSTDLCCWHKLQFNRDRMVDSHEGVGLWSDLLFQKLKESSEMGVLRKKNKYAQHKSKKYFPFGLEIALLLIQMRLISFPRRNVLLFIHSMTMYWAPMVVSHHGIH